ncbi:putative phosphothreonine lyase domain-containg protein [Variovorax sp. J22R115]|uniref:putative phosphothreonine lyase domain-containing protein n=1 Tax=Variovorax sp. J22R115 TaxID=3053509 RepID=UPI0025749A6C|nr:putative phosphothreonine lyase domain-containg protein [Variovorax sp. J22R115]MDM0048811.1 DUF1917 domain-containing protein [Variovorax sp. J22R115]
MLESILNPSIALQEPWLSITAPGEVFSSTDQSGKWLVYRPPETIDKAWIQVLALVSTNGLSCAKVSTRQGILVGYAEHVICVYTRSWRARKEVMRVREVLRNAGFTERLRYKRDVDTMHGRDRFTYEA